MLGRVELRDLVEDLAVVLEGLEAVRQSLRDVHRLAAVRAQLDREVPVERRGASAKVDDDVVDRATGAAHELGLGERLDLVVHSAQRPSLRIEGGAALSDAGLEAALRELAFAPRTREEPALVADRLRFDDVRAGERRFAEDQSKTSTRGIGTTKRPPHSRTYASCSVISSLWFQGRMST